MMELNRILPETLTNRIGLIAQKMGITHEAVLDKLTAIPQEVLIELISEPKREKGDSPAAIDLKKGAIIGCNAISRGIAKLLSSRGIAVTIIGKTPEELQETMTLIQQNLDWMIQKWELTETEKKLMLQYIQPSIHFESLKNVDIVFDTFRGDMSVHQQIYREMDRYLPEWIIVAVDDDTGCLSRLAEHIRNPSRLIGFHVTYPASRRKVVEVTRGKKTSDHTYQKICGVAQFLNKEVVDIVEGASSVSTRLLLTFIHEAIRLWSEGVASPLDIDRTMRLALKIPMGPLEYADTIGLDVVLNMMEDLWQSYDMPQFRPPARLRNLVRKGLLGKKTGVGIHSYESTQIGEAS